MSAHFERRAPALGRSHHDHGPARPLGHARGARFLAHAADFVDGVLHGGGHGLMHRVRVRSFYEVWRPPIAAHQLLQLQVADARQQRGIVDLVAVEVEDGQYRAVANGREEFVDVPGGRQRAGFGFAIAHHRGDDELRIVERSAASVRQHVAQLTAFVDRTGSFRRAVAADPAGEGELLEELAHPLFVLALVGIDFRVGAFQVNRPQHTRSAMPRSGHEYHVQIVFLDQSIQVNIGERQAGTRAPVPEQAVLDVLRPQRLLQQRVLDQIDHPQAEVIAGPPVGVGAAQVFGVQRRSRNRGSRFAVSAQIGRGLGFGCDRWHFELPLYSLPRPNDVSVSKVVARAVTGA